MSNSIPVLARKNSPKLTATARVLALMVGLMAQAACGDSPMAPQPSIDAMAAASVMPAVIDARLRRAIGIENSVVRDRISHDLLELENALTSGDGQKARFHVRVLATVITDYRAQLGSSTTDGADVTAIVLMLHA